MISSWKTASIVVPDLSAVVGRFLPYEEIIPQAPTGTIGVVEPRANPSNYRPRHLKPSLWHVPRSEVALGSSVITVQYEYASCPKSRLFKALYETRGRNIDPHLTIYDVRAGPQNSEHFCCNFHITGIFDEKTVSQHSATPNAADGIIRDGYRDAISYNEFAAPGWASFLCVDRHLRGDLSPKNMAPP